MNATPSIRAAFSQLVSQLLAPVDLLLRGHHREPGLLPPAPLPVWRLIVIVLIFGMLYGAAMGTYFAIGGQIRPLQVLYSGLKVPLLLLVTFALSLPSFFVINTLMGLRSDFAEALRALAAAQAGLTVILSSFAPFTMLWYASSAHYQSAILFNGVMFGTASVVSQMLLRRSYAPLIARSRRHLVLIRAWLVVYAFVGVQMGWVLRPFIGNPNEATTFFREGAWGNAYIAVLRTIGDALGQ